ncbi:MAG: HAD-IA family hydrolase [Candidatus Aenigmatarchaeota archaeon]
MMLRNTIVFDFDDVLVKSWEINRHVAEELSVQAGLKPLPPGTYRKEYGAPFEYLTKKYWEITVGEFIALLKKHALSIPPYSPVEGTIETLKKLEKNHALGILTSRDCHSMPHMFETSGIPEKLFSFVITEDDCHVHKPDPLVFKHVRDVVKGDFCYVGDNHEKDWPAARDAGVPFIAVTSGLSNREDFIKAGVRPERVLQSISMLPDFMSSNNVFSASPQA